MTNPSEARRIVDSFRGLKIAVIGDLMLDVYLWGAVSRISPEAPVPVVNIRRRTSCLGGAGNVMRNLSSLGAEVYGFGAVGDDEAGREIASLLDAGGIDSAFVLSDPGRRTTEKRRIVAGSQQLLREDFEDVSPLSGPLRDALVSALVSGIGSGRFDAVIFEDYAKGVLSSPMLEAVLAAGRGKIVTALDPKPGGVTPVPGLTVIKPNRGEAFAMSGVSDGEPGSDPAADDALSRAAAELFRRWRPQQLLISLAAQGMALYESSKREPELIPTRAREVYDVSGAGDTVTATYTLALAAGASPLQAAEIANRAAGVVVGKMGTVPIGIDELKEAISEKK